MLLKLNGQELNIEDGQKVIIYKYTFTQAGDIKVTKENYEVKIENDMVLFENEEHNCTFVHFELSGNQVSYYFEDNKEAKKDFIEKLKRVTELRISKLNALKEAQLSSYHNQITECLNLLDDLNKYDYNLTNSLTHTNIKELWTFTNTIIDKLCGDHAVIDTGTTFDVMEVVLDAFNHLKDKDLKKIQTMIMGKYWLS